MFTQMTVMEGVGPLYRLGLGGIGVEEGRCVDGLGGVEEDGADGGVEEDAAEGGVQEDLEGEGA